MPLLHFNSSIITVYHYLIVSQMIFSVYCPCELLQIILAQVIIWRKLWWTQSNEICFSEVECDSPGARFLLKNSPVSLGTVCTMYPVKRLLELRGWRDPSEFNFPLYTKAFFRTAHAWMITLHLLQIIVSVMIDKPRGILKSCKKKFDVSWGLEILRKLF